MFCRVVLDLCDFYVLSEISDTITGTQSLIRNPWDQTCFGNRNFSDFEMVVGDLGVRNLVKVLHSLSVLIGKYCSLRCLF
jgi:hypothetical protein